ncbi:MAG TPA: M23 family metallopeptidase [Thermoanaerobaculia bacterium]|nr:M23 family metallopeptidase [Thermoanaerobaculia bacterium]
MAWTIMGSVGRWEKGARNDAADVTTIQTLLTSAAQVQGNPSYDPKGVNGVIPAPPAASDTVAAIESFQRLFMTQPDGVVNVGGRTFDRLVEASGMPPAPAPTLGLGGFFPFVKLPQQPWTTGPRRFEANRNSGARSHAGCDLYFPANTWIYAIADGVVLRDPYHFYDVVFALDVDHGDFIARYGEIRTNCPLKAGDRVKAGNRIAQVGKMKTVDQSMLHLELYDKSATGPLTEQSTTRSKKRKSDGVPFFRRMDLIDPTPLLNQWKTHLPQPQA